MNILFFKRLIQQRQQSLSSQQSSAQTTNASVELDQTRIGRLSRMDAMQMHQMDEASARRRQQEMINLEAALRRIEQGDFGLCLECDEEINPERLEIEPTALFCIQCAQANESNME